MKFVDVKHDSKNIEEVWLALSEIKSEGDTRFLSRQEKRSYQSFIHKRRRREYLSSRNVLYRMADQAGLNIESLEFHKNNGGKPYGIINGERLHVSIAHSDLKVLCAISRTQPIGVDLEPVDRVVDERLHDRILNEKEKQNSYISSLETLQLWTMKEAAVKLIGGALAQYLPILEVESSDKGAFFAKVPDGVKVKVYSRKTEGHWISWAVEENPKR